MLKRDPDFMNTVVYKKDGARYCKQPLTIEFPKWYEDKQLFSISDNTYLYGVFAMICGDKYSLSIIPTVFVTSPILITEIDRDGVPYYQLKYGKDDKIIESDEVIQHSFLSYNFFEAYWMQGKIPWFTTDEDLTRILDNMVQYGASNLGVNQVSNEVVVSFITRDATDKTVFHRTRPGKPYTFVDLMDVRYSTLSTLSKLGGNYWDEAVISALNQPEKKPTTLENQARR